MKVLILTIKKGLQGGVEAATADIYRKLHSDPKYKLGFFDYGSKSDYELKIMKPVFRFIDLVKLIKKIRIFQPDIIHIDTSLNKMTVLRDAPTILLIGIFKIKTFLWIHGTNPASAFSTRFSALLSNFVFSRVDLIGLMSNDEINYFRALYPRRKDSFTLVRPGVNLARLRKIAKKRSAKKLSLLFISRLIADKGPAETVEAYLSSKDKIPPSQLFIAGAGPMENDLRKKTKDSAVKFLGHVKDDNSLYKNSDMLILPTYHNEGMPVTIVKALVFGLPIITTKTRGIKDYLIEGSNCLFVKKKNIADLKEKIIFLANNKPLRQKMSRDNLHLAQMFDSKNAAERLKLIYEK